MPVAVESMTLSGLVDLINEWGTVPRHEAGEQDNAHAPRTLLTGRLGLSGPAVPDDATLTIAAERLHPVFADPHRCADIVNELLAATGVRPAISKHRDGWHSTWLVDEPDRALLAAAAVALRDHLSRYQDQRLGTCTGSRCADVYIDASPAGDRRYCSITCQTRARVAAHRRRRASSRPPNVPGVQ